MDFALTDELASLGEECGPQLVNELDLPSLDASEVATLLNRTYDQLCRLYVP
jgi:predicted solute-binding protein